jgi:septation ring formation regulator EzrA
MKRNRQLASVNELQEATQTMALIADLSRIVDILNVDIASSEQEAKVSDLARPEYPALTRTLRARRDNLLETISALRKRFENLM